MSQASVIIKSRDDVIIQEEKSEQGVSETPEITEVDGTYSRNNLVLSIFDDKGGKKPIDFLHYDEVFYTAMKKIIVASKIFF